MRQSISEFLRMPFTVAKHLIDDEHAPEAVPHLVFLGHPDSTVKLYCLLADRASVQADKQLGTQQVHSVVFTRRKHLGNHGGCTAARLQRHRHLPDLVAVCLIGPNGLPNCWRVIAKEVVNSNAASITPTASAQRAAAPAARTAASAAPCWRLSNGSPWGDPVRHGYARHRHSRLRAFAQYLRLELGAVAPPRPLGVIHGVRLTSLVDTILAAQTVGIKNGMAGRLRPRRLLEGDRGDRREERSHVLRGPTSRRGLQVAGLSGQG
jgi:hypothetical protein